MQTLLVSGCSLTHGCELYNDYMHPENIANSYSRHMADALGLNLVNVALSGGSNGWIYHSLVEQIRKRNDIHSVIAGWTSISRLTWVNENRIWSFIGPWAGTTIWLNPNEDIINVAPLKYNIEYNGVWFNADTDENIESLKSQHKFLVENYLNDTKRLKTELDNYKYSLRSICNDRGIKLVEWDSFTMRNTSSTTLHPNKDDHYYTAQKLLNKFYRNL